MTHPEQTPTGMPSEQEVRTWAMILHLSQFCGYLAPVAGLVVPILIWQIQKQRMPELDVHGKIVVNWIISSLIYIAICIPLFFVVIGIPLLMVLGVLLVIFPIIGGIKAANGEAWRYPLSIRFLD